MQVKSSLLSDGSGGGGEAVPLVQNLFLTKFPKLTDHKNHFLGIAAGLSEKTDKRVVEYVKELARRGFRDKDELDRHILMYVEEKLNITCDLTLRRRF